MFASPRASSASSAGSWSPRRCTGYHSIHRDETDSNFGFNLPWWDRIFGTYRAQPRDGHEDMTIGIDRFREPRDQRLDRMLVQPFRSGMRESKAEDPEP